MIACVACANRGAPCRSDGRPRAGDRYQMSIDLARLAPTAHVDQAPRSPVRYVWRTANWPTLCLARPSFTHRHRRPLRETFKILKEDRIVLAAASVMSTKSTVLTIVGEANLHATNTL
jgi:hypothetical protein